jgi:hypothetical protein
MKVAKSLVKKGGKKSLKKTLKMRKSKKGGKKGGKKSLNTKKARKSRKMKGGELTTEYVDVGDCVKIGFKTYTVIEKDDFADIKTLTVKDSNGNKRKGPIHMFSKCIFRRGNKDMNVE